MAFLDRFYRRWLNFWALEYTLAELWEWIRLQWRRPRVPVATRSYDGRESAPFFEQVLVISLSFRTDRRVAITQQLSRLGLSFRFFEAIHGQSVAEEELTRFFSPLSRRYLPNGSLGCALSHARVWAQVVAEGWASCLVLEDDVRLSDSFLENWHQWQSEVPPDFDLLYLGSGLTAPRHIRRFVAPHVFEPYYPREGMYAYVVSARGAQRLLQRVFPMHLANGGVDTAVGKCVRKVHIRAYHLLPVLAEADLESPSNVPNPGGNPKVLHSSER